MASVSAPAHTQIVAPGSTDTSHHRLRIAATVCWKLFERCTKVSPSHLGRNYGKFKVWCGNLGVRQGGHASLDWRLKDDDIMESEVFSMLTDLEDDLQQVLELLSGTRLPYEQEEPGSETSSLNDSMQPGELETRLDAIDATITALYQMSFVVRNQGTRRLASAKAQNYQPRDPDEAALLESFVSFDRQHIDDLFRDLRRPRSEVGQPMATRPNLRSDGDAQDKAIKARCLAASTARRRQLAYWKMHSSKLKSVAMISDTADLDQNATIYSGTEASGVFKRIERDSDLEEVQSLTSVASTVRDIDGHETEFPGPPERSSDDDPFECPYCYVLCQPEEAGRRRWKKHILEDLRPYICTYPDCQDDTQLYGNRREWTAHEDAAHRSSMTSDDSKKSLATDDREQCPICLLDVAELPGRTNLTKHLASHLERFSLDCLPLNTSSWGDQNIRDDSSESSDLEPDMPSEPHKQTVSDEREMERRSFEAQTTGNSRVDENKWSEEDLRAVKLKLGFKEGEKKLLEDESRRRMFAETINDMRTNVRSYASSPLKSGWTAETIEAKLEQLIEGNQRKSRGAERGDEADEVTSMGESARSNADAKDDNFSSPDVATSALKKFVDAAARKKELELKLESTEAGNKQLREERERLVRNEFSITEWEMEHWKAVAEKAQAILLEDHSRRRHGAGEEIGAYEVESRVNHESYDSGPEDNLRDDIDAERRRIIQDYERRQHELKQQEDREVAELVRRREEGDVSKNEAERDRDAQEELDDAMRKRLIKSGFTQYQIGDIMGETKSNQQQPASNTPKTAAAPEADAPTKPHVPVYPKIHVDYLATEPLKYYGLPWEYDRSDPSYIIILRELAKPETNVLFDFTKRLREGRLILNESGDKIIEQRTKTSVLPRKD